MLRPEGGIVPLAVWQAQSETLRSRGYSIAFNLPARLGFNSFATRTDRNIHDALKGLIDF